LRQRTHLRKQGAVRVPFSSVARKIGKSCQITGKENCYNLGWADVNSLAEDLDSLDATLEHVYHLGVAEVLSVPGSLLKVACSFTGNYGL